MENYHEVKQMLCKELDNIAKEGKLTAGNLDAIDKITHSIKSLVTIMAMEESGYSSERGYSGAQRRDSMGRYMDAGPSYGGSYGRYMDGGSMDGGYSGRRYSRDEGRNHMMSQLENLMQNASSPEEREVMQQAMSRLKNM